MTRLTGIIIQTRGDDVKCSASKCMSKYSGSIDLYDGDEFDRTLASTDAIYNSRYAALEAMEDLIKEVRKMTLV